jgi:hypothetical protein
MQESTITPAIVPKASRTAYFFSITLLVLIIGLSLGFFMYNIYIEKGIQDLKIGNSEIRNEIEELSKDRKIILTRIEKTNTIRPSIDLKGIIADFYDAASRANVRLKGFSIVNDTISTSLTATQWDETVHPDAAGTIIKMIREYAAWRGWSFSLEPINAMSGDPSERTTGIQFKVIANPNK